MSEIVERFISTVAVLSKSTKINWFRWNFVNIRTKLVLLPLLFLERKFLDPLIRMAYYGKIGHDTFSTWPWYVLYYFLHIIRKHYYWLKHRMHNRIYSVKYHLRSKREIRCFTALFLGEVKINLHDVEPYSVARIRLEIERKLFVTIGYVISDKPAIYKVGVRLYISHLPLRFL